MKYVLITGGISGKGFELAKNFISDGYGIVIAASNIERLQKARIKLEDEFETKVLIYQQDMGKIGAAIQLYKQSLVNRIIRWSALKLKLMVIAKMKN